MKKILDWQSKEVVDIFDEVNLWSAPFGRMMLENLPMKRGMTVVDIGFGTGFPLLELAQRFGEDSKIYGIDIWEEAINRTKKKIEVLGLDNVEILEASASEINIADNTIDLVTSNLGVNNFEERTKVYTEVYRILKKGGALCITTNPIGTFQQLFDQFRIVLEELKLEKEIGKLESYIENRKTEEQIIQEIESHNFRIVKKVNDKTNMRFIDARALFNHSLTRVGFRTGWDDLIDENDRIVFYEKLHSKIEQIISTKGAFQIDIPMIYLQFEK